jgi:hypothetical protein
MELLFSPLIPLILLAALVAIGFNVLREYERAVTMRERSRILPMQ